MVLSWKLFVDSCRLISICIFLICSFTINWYSFASLICLIGSLYLLDRDTYNRPIAQQEGGTLQQLNNPYKGHKRVADEENVSNELKLSYTQRILDHVLYDVENCQVLCNFEPVKMNTHCTFARTAVLWGARDYDDNLSIEANVERSIPSLIKFLILGPSLHLDGFVFELPGDKYGMDIETFGQGVRRILKCISDQDPAGYHCMNKSFVSQIGWTFEFDYVPIFVTTFAPCYPSNHSRYAFGAKNGFVLLQPMYSFAIHDIGKDTPITNWENPKTIRDKIRVAFKENGRPYHIRPTVYYPMAHDIVKPLIEGPDNVLKWWEVEGGESCSSSDDEEGEEDFSEETQDGDEERGDGQKGYTELEEEKSDHLLIDDLKRIPPSDENKKETQEDLSVQHNLLPKEINCDTIIDKSKEKDIATTTTTTNTNTAAAAATTTTDEMTQKLLHEAMNEDKGEEIHRHTRNNEKERQEDNKTDIGKVFYEEDSLQDDNHKRNEDLATNETNSQNLGEQKVDEKKEDEDTSSFEDISAGSNEEDSSTNTHEY